MNRRSVLEAAGDYRIKATLGITGWLCLSVHSDGTVRHLNSRYHRGIELHIGVPIVVMRYKNNLAYNGGLHTNHMDNTVGSRPKGLTL